MFTIEELIEKGEKQFIPINMESTLYILKECEDHVIACVHEEKDDYKFDAFRFEKQEEAYPVKKKLFLERLENKLDTLLYRHPATDTKVHEEKDETLLFVREFIEKREQ